MKQEIWKFGSFEVPVQIFKEWRNSHRISIRKDKVIIRAPKHSLGLHGHSIKDWATEWLNEKFDADPGLINRFKIKSFYTGFEVKTTHKEYRLNLIHESRKTSTYSVEQNDVSIKLPTGLGQLEESKTIESLIHRAIGNDQKSLVKNRIFQLNDRYFKSQINDIRLKFTKNNWGSCSSKGRINISTRVLFAPEKVQDYVFVHELAHLVEMNHSPAFWKLVQAVMPNFREEEQWIRKYGDTCGL